MFNRKSYRRSSEDDLSLKVFTCALPIVQCSLQHMFIERRDSWSHKWAFTISSLDLLKEDCMVHNWVHTHTQKLNKNIYSKFLLPTTYVIEDPLSKIIWLHTLESRRERERERASLLQHKLVDNKVGSSRALEQSVNSDTWANFLSPQNASTSSGQCVCHVHYILHRVYFTIWNYTIYYLFIVYLVFYHTNVKFVVWIL